MRRPLAPSRLLALALATSFAAYSLGAAEETYQLVQFSGQPCGSGRSLTSELLEHGETLFETRSEQTLRISRMDQPLEVTASSLTVEDAKGKIRRLRETMLIAKNEATYEGVVKGDKLEATITTTGKPSATTIAWSDDLPGPREQSRRIAATGFRPGTTLVYHVFKFELGEPAELTLTIEGDEEVDLPSGKRTLHRIDVKSDSAALPASTIWVDDEGQTRKERTSLLGNFCETVDVTKEQFSESIGGVGAEIFAQSMIRANRRLPDRESIGRIDYRLTPKEKDGKFELPADTRQDWIDVADGPGKLFRVQVTVPGAESRQAVGVHPQAKALQEFLVPNPLVQSDDPKIVAFAKDAIDGEKNAWEAAKLLEKAVHDHITKKNMGVGFASAGETFETCEGDCTEHAVLLAACCRAAGVPARVAMGLVYADFPDGGYFAGHAWTEVSIDGAWYGLDATIGKGVADPTHIRMASTSLKDGAFQTAFGGIVQCLGRIDLEIVTVD